MMNKLNNCPVCDASDFSVLYQVEDTNQDVTGQWSILKCNKCDLGVLYPFPEAKDVQAFYRDVFYNKEGKRFRGSIEKLRAFFGYIRAWSFLKVVKKKQGKLLDFGSGAGHFGCALSKLGWDVHSLDPYSEASDYSREGHPVRDDIKLKFYDDTFDAITLWYVIEHLRNPEAILKELNRVLKPGGVLLLAQQDFSSFQAKVFKSNWLILDPPRHLYQFSPKNLLILAEKDGFVKLCVTHTSLELGPYTMLQSMLNGILGNKNYLFKFLKSPDLSTKSKKHILMVVTSLLLSVLLAPTSLVLYFVLLIFKSGDIFNLYLQKIKNVY